MKWIRCIIVLIPAGFFAYCFWMYFAIAGEWSVATDFSKDKTVISELTPIGRATRVDGQGGQTVTGEPVYMTIMPPRRFERAQVEWRINARDERLITTGVVLDEDPFTVRTQLLYSALVEEAIAAGFEIVRTDTEVVYTRRADVRSSADLERVTDARGVVYNVAAHDSAIPPCLSTERWTLPATLLGDHDLVFVVQPQTEASEIVVHHEIHEGEVALYDAVRQEKVSVEEDNGDHFRLAVPASESPALYTLRMSGTGSTQFSQLTFPTACVSAQRYTFADVSASGITLVQSHDRTTVSAISPQGFGTYQLSSGETVTVDTLHAPVQVYAKDRGATLTLPHGGVRIVHSGYMGLSAQTTFDPRGRILPLDETTQLNDIDVIILDTIPEIKRIDGVLRSTVVYDLRHLSAEAEHVQLLLSSQGIAARAGAYHVLGARATFLRPAAWTLIRQRFSL